MEITFYIVAAASGDWVVHDSIRKEPNITKWSRCYQRNFPPAKRCDSQVRLRYCQVLYPSQPPFRSQIMGRQVRVQGKSEVVKFANADEDILSRATGSEERFYTTFGSWYIFLHAFLESHITSSSSRLTCSVNFSALPSSTSPDIEHHSSCTNTIQVALSAASFILIFMIWRQEN